MALVLGVKKPKMEFPLLFPPSFPFLLGMSGQPNPAQATKSETECPTCLQRMRTDSMHLSPTEYISVAELNNKAYPTGATASVIDCEVQQHIETMLAAEESVAIGDVIRRGKISLDTVLEVNAVALRPLASTDTLVVTLVGDGAAHCIPVHHHRARGRWWDSPPTHPPTPWPLEGNWVGGGRGHGRKSERAAP